MQPYSPFAKPIGEITTQDLASLRQVSEGWYIEYKRETPSPAALAKSLLPLATPMGAGSLSGSQKSQRRIRLRVLF